MQIIFTSRIPQGKQNPWHRRCTKIQGRVLRAQTLFFFFFFCQLDVLVLKGARARHVVEMMLKWFIQYHANQVLWIEVKNLDVAVSGS